MFCQTWKRLIFTKCTGYKIFYCCAKPKKIYTFKIQKSTLLEYKNLWNILKESDKVLEIALRFLFRHAKQTLLWFF